MIDKLRSKVSSLFSGHPCPRLFKAVIPLNNVRELMKAYAWQKPPVLEGDPSLHAWEYIEDANERRIRDAEVLGCVMGNTDGSTALEIGTAEGRSTALMHYNGPNSRIFTVNIPPEEIIAGKGGVHTTFALEKEKIGRHYRSLGLGNITQIYANTATWEPDIGPIDVAFIDGCHDADFVYNDTRKVLAHMKPGSFVLWHDFNMDLMAKFDWIGEVCVGVERLLADGLIRGRILHVRDSWIGVYRVPPAG